MARRLIVALALFFLAAGPALAARPSAAEVRAIEQDCARLSADYAYVVDFDDPAGLAALFTPDGVWTLTNNVHKGRAEIQAYLTAFIAKKTEGRRHFITNVRITVVDRDHATGTAYVEIFHPDLKSTERPLPFAIGVFRDAYVRTPDGWKFASRQLRAQ